MNAIGPGDRVVCEHLRPRGSLFDDSLGRLRVGAVYVVAHIFFDGSIMLRGVRSSHPRGSWNPGRFRPFDDGDSQRLIERLGVDMKEKVDA